MAGITAPSGSQELGHPVLTEAATASGSYY